MDKIIEQLEAGDYQRGRAEQFRFWAKTITPEVHWAEIEAARDEMESFDKDSIFHNYTEESIELRTKIQRTLEGIEKKKETDIPGANQLRVLLAALLMRAAKVIKEEAGEIGGFRLAAALRYRFILSFSWDMAEQV